MDFTREPIIETIITPKDGCKLVVRSSKGAGQEEYFVDAVEVVAFGNAIFFRSLERPKPFLVPVTDYEIMEVREARMVLKTVSPERSIKIGGGREAAVRAPREAEKIEVSAPSMDEELVSGAETPEQPAEANAEVRLDKKRDRRRHYRKRRNGKDEPARDEVTGEIIPEPSLEEGGKVNIMAPEEMLINPEATTPITPNILSSLLQPPPTLISETISRYRENALFKNAFFMNEEDQYKPHDKVQDLLSEEDDFTTQLKEPIYSTGDELSNEKIEEIPLPSQQASDSSFIMPPEGLITPVEHAEDAKKDNGRTSKKRLEHEGKSELEEDDTTLPLFSEDLNGISGEDGQFPKVSSSESNKDESTPNHPQF